MTSYKGLGTQLDTASKSDEFSGLGILLVEQIEYVTQ